MLFCVDRTYTLDAFGLYSHLVIMRYSLYTTILVTVLPFEFSSAEYCSIAITIKAYYSNYM